MKMIDLCAGIGGIRRGFELASPNYNNVLSAENDKYACSTYKHLFGSNPLNDITDRDFKDLVKKTEFDILLAGFPCQSFSRAGNQDGFLDATRGTLFFEIAEIIKENRPKAFLLENVDNLLSHLKGETFKIILKVLMDELDYSIIGVSKNENGEFVFNRKDLIRNTRNFGLPQNRPRVYLMGFKNELLNKQNQLSDLILPTSNNLTLYKDVNEVLDEDVEYKYYMASGSLETLKRHRKNHESKGNGFGYVVINKNKDCPIANALLATGGSGKERNLVYSHKEGVPGKIVSNKKTPLNDEYIRNMTPNEWAKLQGFKNYAFLDADGNDDFSFPSEISETQQYKQLGNAVSIPVIQTLACFMNEILNEVKKEED